MHPRHVTPRRSLAWRRAAGVALILASVTTHTRLNAQASYTLLTGGTANIGASAFSATVSGGSVSADGTKVIFFTAESLSPLDTDTARDIYMASGGVITLLSDGTSGVDANVPVTFRRMPLDGLANRVFFSTTESLVAEDVDTALDVYVAAGGTVALVTGGTANLPADLIDGGSGNYGVSFDGSTVYFYTEEAIDPADTDTAQDLYRSINGVVTLISIGADANRIDYAGMTDDGASVYYWTHAVLSVADINNDVDIYEARNGSHSIITPGHLAAGATSFAGASADGRLVIMNTNVRWQPGPGQDEDIRYDCYLWNRTAASHILITGDSIYPNGPDPYDAECRAISPDGSRIYFDSAQDLVPGDVNQHPTALPYDVYLWQAGSLTLLTSGAAGVSSGLRQVSADGTNMIIGSNGRLTGADTDNAFDLYLRSSGVYTLLTPGTSTQPIVFGISRDLTRAYYVSTEAIDPTDVDGQYDSYEGSSLGARLLTPGTAAPIFFVGASDDGETVVVTTSQSLNAADADTTDDLYEVTPVPPDSEPPVVTLAVTNPPDALANTGWYNLASSGSDGVQLQVSAVDPSGIASITVTDGPTTILYTAASSGTVTLTDGQHVANAVASDPIGNTGAAIGSTLMPITINVDQTPPTVTCASPTVFLNAGATPVNVASVADATSGPTSASLSVVLNTATVGPKTVSVTGSDQAGNQTTRSCDYRVVYQFTGFGAPVSAPPNQYVGVSVTKIVPLTFTLRDAQGAPILGLNPRAVIDTDVADPTQCAGQGTSLVASDYVKGKTGLVEVGNGSYQFRWKASRSPVGQCRRFTLNLGDGVIHAVGFLLIP